MSRNLELTIRRQPDDTTCGPTCLHALYRYYGDDVPLERVVAEVPSLSGGGTLGVMLANHALLRGYRASIYTYNLMIFDPTWFQPGVDLVAKLKQRALLIDDAKQCLAIEHYLAFLQNGGRIHFKDMQRDLLRRFLLHRRPLLTGLNSTYLYRRARVQTQTDADDDVGGQVVGHFVVLCGYHPATRQVRVADPYAANPFSHDHFYEVSIDRVVGAILLGVMTYDANFLVVEPRSAQGGISQ